MDDRNWNEDFDFDVNYFHYARDHGGKLIPVGIVRRNKRAVPRFDPLITEPDQHPDGDADQPGGASQASVPWIEDPRYYVNLNEVESRTWRLILSAKSISEIARIERVKRQAILCRIRGNSKGQGGMIAKNFWVLLWWRIRRRRIGL
jgi:hypothetical protein